MWFAVCRFEAKTTACARPLATQRRCVGLQSFAGWRIIHGGFWRATLVRETTAELGGMHRSCLESNIWRTPSDQSHDVPFFALPPTFGFTLLGMAVGRSPYRNSSVELRRLMTDKFTERAIWIEKNVLPYEPDIRAWLRTNRVHGLEIDDVIQEMYATIGSLETLEAIRDPKRYAFQVALSILIHYVRRSKIVSIIPAGNLADLNIASPEANPEQHALIRDDFREIADAIDSLPTRTREVLLMRRVQGLSQRETANRLSIAEKTVEKHLARAGVMLMDRFGRGGKKAARPSILARRLGRSDKGDDS